MPTSIKEFWKDMLAFCKESCNWYFKMPAWIFLKCHDVFLLWGRNSWLYFWRQILQSVDSLDKAQGLPDFHHNFLGCTIKTKIYVNVYIILPSVNSGYTNFGPPRPTSPPPPSFLQKIRIDSEWPKTARNRIKIFCPLVTPPLDRARRRNFLLGLVRLAYGQPN